MVLLKMAALVATTAALTMGGDYRELPSPIPEHYMAEAKLHHIEDEQPPLADEQENNYGIIFIGDSRTVGMANAVADSENNNIFFVSKVGQGLKWFKETAIEEVEKIKEENDHIKHWTIISNLGVNDLHNANKYKEQYDQLLKNEWKGDRFYFVTVNPVIDDLTTVSNQSIRQFNRIMSEKYQVINTYDFVSGHMESKDGLHYSRKLNEKIYEMILDSCKTEAISIG